MDPGFQPTDPVSHLLGVSTDSPENIFNPITLQNIRQDGIHIYGVHSVLGDIPEIGEEPVTDKRSLAVSLIVI
jgi:hypothetical protein